MTGDQVAIERRSVFGAIDLAVRSMEAAYYRAMDEGVSDGSHWERFADDARTLHELAEAACAESIT